MDFPAITETQKFWESFRKIPELQDISHTSLDQTTDALEKHRDNLHSIDPESMTPEGGGDIGEILDAVGSALSHARVAINEINRVQSLVDEINESFDKEG